jgi:DNA repair photolyase
MAERFRWKLADDDEGQAALFAEEELTERHVGKGEFRGLEFLHVNARRVINEVPNASRMPFRFTINAYRGCSHACVYCMSGETPILMADGRTKLLADVRPGDRIYGTEKRGTYRHYVTTEVVAHWSTVKRAYRVTLEDGTELVTSGDHRFLTNRGWKHVVGAGAGPECRPHLTLTNELLGTGQFAEAPDHDADYGRGYLCGMVRGDGTLGSYTYARPHRVSTVHRFRLALSDLEPLHRAKALLERLDVPTKEFAFAAGSEHRKAMTAIRTSRAGHLSTIREIVDWPETYTDHWARGFLAGIFDAEGSYSRGILRIVNQDEEILETIGECLDLLRIPWTREPVSRNGCSTIRVTGGIQQHLRFFLATDPATTRKRTIEGQAIKNKARLRVKSIEPLGIDLPMYDITTGTGDFIANGVVSHNCFARPTHEYLDLNIGSDFDSKIVVKVNAVERVRAELRSAKWHGDHIAMGTNTDPYQRAEGKYHLTQGIVRALTEAENPFSILTKSTLILRDVDLLVEAAQRTSVRANFSIGTLDEATWKATEPGTPHPRQRVEAVRKLNAAGVDCGVLVAPVIPGMSDLPGMVEEVVTACVEAGAVSVSPMYLHLRPKVREHFMAWMDEARPDLVADYARRYRRAYVAKGDGAELSARARDAIRRAGGLADPRQRGYHAAARPAAQPEISTPPEQLSFS